SILLTTFLISTSSCQRKTDANNSNEKDIVIESVDLESDTTKEIVYVLDGVIIDSLISELEMRDSVNFELALIADSLMSTNREFAIKYVKAKLAINQIDYYVQICNKNKSQDKFLRGWMNRVLDAYK